MKKLFAKALLLSVSATAAAQQSAEKPAPEKDHGLSVVFGTFSHHVNESEFLTDRQKAAGYRFNNFNPELAVEDRFGKHFFWTAGGLYNSLRRASFYAGVGVETDPKRRFGVGVEVGPMTGYPFAPVVPAAAGLGFIHTKKFDVEIVVEPEVPHEAPWVIHERLRFNHNPFKHSH